MYILSSYVFLMRLNVVAFVANRFILALIGWTAWPIWRNLENPFKERYHKVEKSAKNQIFQNKSKKLGKRPRMYFAIFDGFGPILMIFIDQNMRIHDFSLLSVKNQWILSQILFKTNDFHENSIFIEKLLRNDPKIRF